MDNKINELRKELKYLTKEAIELEIENNKNKLEKNNVKQIAKEIYVSRGLDVDKLNNNITSNLTNDISTFFNSFNGKDKITKRKMVFDIIYLIILIILLKIPFDLVRDVGYEFVEILTTNSTFKLLWDLAFLLLYTITAICTFRVLVKNFNNNYNK